MMYGCREEWRDDPYHDWDWDNDGYPGEFIYGDSTYVDDYYMNERWKPIKGFRNYYISDKGRLYSSLSDSFIRPTPVGDCGHLDVCLWDNGRRYHRYIHRLVAETFIPNPYNLPMVRHLDNDPTNNEVENLAWGTQLNNMRDCIEAGRFRYFSDKDRELAMQKRRTSVTAVNLKTGEEIEYISQQEASRDLGMTQGSINGVLRGLSTHAHGYYFYFTNDPKPIDVRNYKYSRHDAFIKAIDLHSGKEYIFKGQTEAARKLGMSISSVSMVLSGKMRSAKGFVFNYIDEEVI